MEIAIEKINEKSFEEGYKVAYLELLKLREKGITDQKVGIYFSPDGEWAGHVWGRNCFYTNSDLEANGIYVCPEGIDLFFPIESWEREVEEEYAIH